MNSNIKKLTSTILVLASSVFLAACASGNDAASDGSSKTDKTEQTEQNKTDTKKTDTEEKNSGKETSDADSENAGKDSSGSDSSDQKDTGASGSQTDTGKTDGTAKTDGSEKTDGSNAGQSETGQTSGKGTAASGSQTESSSSVQTLNAQVSQTLADAYRNLGYGVSGVTYQTSDTGNQVGIFTVEAGGQPIQVYVTTAASGNNAADTFNMNTQNDEAMNMQVMNEYTDNGNTVRVVRNNRANANFIEVLDTWQRTAIHIEDSLPDQLQASLNALNAVRYPVQ